MSRKPSSYNNASQLKQFTDTAYDNVVIVAEHIDEIISLADGIDIVTLYLGAFPSAPTEGHNGNPLVAGNFYLNTTTGQIEYYDDTPGEWVAVDTETVIQAAQGAMDAQLAAEQAQAAAELAESNAQASENAAAISETNAATSANNSQNSANASASSASDSATSAAEALASENAAKASETAAAQSESNASTSETNAANSASAAATSESNAAQSENSASNFATQAAQSAANAEAAFDNFDDKYLGAKATDPTTDNDGNPLQVGATYWNTTEDEQRFWSGASWDVPSDTAIQAANTAVAARDDAQVSETNAAASEAAAAQSETNAAQSAADALASENAAASSETNAANSASSASASATSAANSATSAATSESNAETSESNAATSEMNAATSESNAEASASAASTSETNAATSASNAATSESNANDSENAAFLHEQNSLNNATAASNSASAAATSESNASTSETNAATSASNAATSEANAAQSAADAQQSADDAAAVVPNLQSQIDNRPMWGEVGLVKDSPYKAVGFARSGSDSSTDLDTLIEPGFYYRVFNGPNKPSGFTGYWYIQVMTYASTGNTTQIAYPYGTSSGSGTIAYRTRFGDVWESWKYVYSTDYKPTAQDVGAYTTTQVDSIESGLQNQIDTLDGEVVKISGDQTISGIKKFNQDILATSISSELGVDQGLLFFSSGSTRLGGTGSAAGIQLRPNGRNVEDDTDYFNFKPNGTVEYAGTSNFSISRTGGSHGIFAYEDGRTFLTGNGGNIELRPKGLSDASKGLSMSSTGTTIHSHSGGAFLSFRDAVNDGTNSSSYMQWMHLDNTRRGFLGYGSSANNNMTWFNDEGNNTVVLKEDGNVQVNAELTIFNTKELRVESTGDTNLDLYRSDGDANVNIRFGSNTGNDIYFGKTNSNFAMGASQNLSATENQWVVFNSTNSIFRNPVYLPYGVNPTAADMAARKAYVDTVASDERLKSNIKTVDDALSIVNQIPVHTYLKKVLEYNEESEQDEVVHKFEYGFIAQEIEEVLPHLVTEREQDGMKEILRTGNDLHALSFRAIQQLSESNSTLLKENRSLRNEVDELKSELALIKKHLGL